MPGYQNWKGQYFVIGLATEQHVTELYVTERVHGTPFQELIRNFKSKLSKETELIIGYSNTRLLYYSNTIIIGFSNSLSIFTNNSSLHC